MSIASRRRLELVQKLKSFDDDLKRWNDDTQKDKPLEKHRTQMEALTALLSARRDQIEEKIKTLDSDDKVLASAGATINDIRETFRVWGYFRKKLALRLIASFHDYLEAADELCFKLYRPFVQAKKEPPLVYFEDKASLMTIARARAFSLLDGGEGGKLTSELLEKTMKSMPFPVIGIPWSQVQHLPDATVLAHEVGHCVEQDLDLQTPLDNTFQKLGARQDAWRAWRSEVFADVFGALTLGPAFARTAVDLLANNPKDVVAQTKVAPKWGDYPTDALRVLLVLKAIEEEGHKTIAAQIRAEWSAKYPTHALKDHEKDLPSVVAAIRGVLPATPRFTPAMQTNAEKAAKALTADQPSDPSGDVVVLIAAAAIAFADKPDVYRERACGDIVIEKILAIRSPGVRGGNIAKAKTRKAEENLEAFALLAGALSEDSAGGSSGGGAAELAEDRAEPAHGDVEPEPPKNSPDDVGG
jgi:hypothetical protein